MPVVQITGADISGGAKARFSIAVKIGNVTRAVIMGMDELQEKPRAVLEFDEACKVLCRAIWARANGTTNQKINALLAGVSGDQIGFLLRDYLNGVDIES